MIAHNQPGGGNYACDYENQHDRKKNCISKPGKNDNQHQAAQRS